MESSLHKIMANTRANENSGINVHLTVKLLETNEVPVINQTRELEAIEFLYCRGANTISVKVGCVQILLSDVVIK